jgi:cob(I)alamin adenosyltransferase
MIQVSKLSWSDVNEIIEEASKKALEIGIPTNIAVVDEAGILLGFKRMDGSLAGCAQIAIDKAYTAAALGVTTLEEWKMAQPGGSDYGVNTLYGGRLTTIGGGLPIKLGNQILGGIGVSTGTVEQDAVTAEAGLNAFLRKHVK